MHRDNQSTEQATRSRDRGSCDAILVASGNSLNVDLPKRSQPIFVKVAAASEYYRVSGSVVDARSSIMRVEAGKIFPKRPIAPRWLFKNSSQSSVKRTRSTHTSPGSDSDDGYVSDDDLYSDPGSDSDSKSSSGSDSGEGGDHIWEGKWYRMLDEKTERATRAGCGCVASHLKALYPGCHLWQRCKAMLMLWADLSDRKSAKATNL